MLILLPEDEKPGFFFHGLFMDRLPPVSEPTFSQNPSMIPNPHGIAQHADELSTIGGWGVSVQTLSDDQFEDKNALPRRSFRRGSRSRSIV